MTNFRRHLPTIIGLFVALGLPFILMLYLGSVRVPVADTSRVILSLARAWGSTIALLILVLFWERQSLSSIGTRKMSGKDALWGLAGFLLGVLTFMITTPLIKAINLSAVESGISRLAEIPLSLRLSMVLTAGITEEILFRGYPIERLNALTGHIGLSATVTYVVFVILHIPFWGPGAAIQIGVWSLVVTALYVWRRNLIACMLMHVLNDAFAFILLPMFLSQRLT